MSFGESMFPAGFNHIIGKRIKTSNRIKLNHDENYSRRLQRTPEDTTP
jgi:hypothetical protein